MIWKVVILQRKLLPTFSFSYTKCKKQVFISGLTIRNDNLYKRRKEVNQFLERKCSVEKFGFIDNQNINLKMLNQSGLHLNEYGTRRLVNNFCYNLIKWWDAICLERNAIGKSVKTKKINSNLNLKASMPNMIDLLFLVLKLQTI